MEKDHALEWLRANNPWPQQEMGVVWEEAMEEIDAQAYGLMLQGVICGCRTCMIKAEHISDELGVELPHNKRDAKRMLDYQRGM